MFMGNRTSGLLLQTMLYLSTQNGQNNTETNTLYHVNIGEEYNGTKCYGVYGCFAISSPWVSEHRPVSMYPESPEKINPGFLVYLDKDQTDPIKFDIYDSDAVKLTGMDPKLPIYIIAHGYLESGYKTWMRDLRLELLNREKCVVVHIDWQGGSNPPYAQAVANIRLVGAMTAHLLDMIAAHTGPLGLSHVHLIGHSLGAHLSGYVGYTLQKDFNLMIGRITGLDPAEPHFAKSGAPVRLGPQAAKYVDVIHTDASTFIKGGLGIIEKVGHVDFYPNGGTDQPGCDQGLVQYVNAEEGSFFKGMRRFLGCNHVRSYEFFIESINTPCPYLGITCNSYKDFKDGKCFQCDTKDNQCVKFGYHSLESYEKLINRKIIQKDQRLVLYMMTGAERPFCRSHYRLTVKISNSTISRNHKGEIGQIFLTILKKVPKSLNEEVANSGKMALSDSRYLEPGKVYTSVVPGQFISELNAVRVEFRYNSSFLNPLTWRILSVPKLYVESVLVDSMEAKKSIKICPKNKEMPLLTGKPQIWVPAFCN